MTGTAGETPAAAHGYADPDCFSIAAGGHNLTFYPGGPERLESLIALIDGAQTSLGVFYYIFDKDRSGRLVRDALVGAARRGVRVDVIVDAFGNDAGADFFAPLIAAGGSFAVFSPRWGTRYLVRNHQKFVIADNARVMTGGANVQDAYFASVRDDGWCDLAVLIEGAVAARFAEWFALVQAWVANAAGGHTRSLRKLRDLVRDWDGGEGPVRLLVGGPLVRRGHWAWVFRQDLQKATRLDTVSPYFSPPRSFRRLFRRIGRRGTARMIMAGKSDIGAAIDMARLLYGKLLRARVTIFEFAPAKLHLKLLVVDDVSYVGSANLDKRSFRINVELMVRIEDAGLAARLREMIDHFEQASVPITPAWYARQSTFFNKLRWRLAYWASLADYRISKAGTV